MNVKRTRLRVGQASVVAALTFAFVSPVAAQTTTLTVEAIADTYLRQGNPNRNQGALAFLRVRDAGNNRILVRFDASQVLAALAGQTLVKANLELFIEDNGGNWTAQGGTVDAHRLTASWMEASATWNCPADTNLANSQPDCATPWNGGTFAVPATSSVLHTNGLLGWVQWEVTPDVASLVSGTPHFGWLIKKKDESRSGLADYTSREGTAGRHPRLVLTVLPRSTLQIEITGVTDGQVTNQDLLIEYRATGAEGGTVSAILERNGQAGTPFSSGDTVSTEGAYRLTVTATDGAGQQKTETRSFVLDKTAPVIVGSIAPAPNAAGWNRTDVTVGFTCSDALAGVATCPASVPVTTEGRAQSVMGEAVDRAGNRAVATVEVNLDKTPPVVAVGAPADGAVRLLPRVQVSGTVDDASPVGAVTVNGVPAETAVEGSTGGSLHTFTADVPLAVGAQSLIVTAQDIADNIAIAALTVTYRPPPSVRITSPADLQAFGTSPVTVEGTVDDPQATVAVGVERIPAVVSGNHFTATGVPLREGGNVVTAVATGAAGSSGTDSVTVVLDTVAPRVIVDSPANNSVTTEDSLVVSGRVSDVVMGTVNSGQARVFVNGLPAVVANRTFLSPPIALVPGPNTITATATDAVGNSDSKTTVVLRENIPSPRITAVSGSGQTAGIGELLPAPLVVAVTDAEGHALAGRSVVFRVDQNNGSLLAAAGNPVRALVITTDAEGRVQARHVLGTRAGAGNNRVEATSPGIPGAASFVSTGRTHPPANITVDSGNNQRGTVGQPLPRPLVAVVTDEGHDRLAGVSVTFAVTQGDGSFEGQPSVTVTTDPDGRALATLTLGPNAAVENTIVAASVEGLPDVLAGFTASGLEPGDPAQTRISGVVLDNSNLPIAGVTLRIRGTALAAASDAQGQFTLTGVPVGDAHLVVDGSTAQRPGTWPDLEFQLFTVPGADNSVGMPIYLLSLDTGHGLFVDETHGGTLTLPEVPGFSLTVTPNSAIFPDGTRRGTITVTPVHADKVPMIPNFGQQPRFIVTIQPPGVRFDPPAAITHPNVDGLAPGEVTELYSFDHDMGSFVATGTATVSEDGLVLRSDPGTGIIKGGWHCGGNPATQGTTACCPDCKSCDPQTMKCKADPDQTPPKKCLGNNDSNPNKPRVEPTLAACGITVELDESCMGECKKGKCEMPKTSDRWRPNLLMAGLQQALSNICNSTCGPQTATAMRDALREFTAAKVPIKIFCNTSPPPNGVDACGYSGPPPGTPAGIVGLTVTADNFSTTSGNTITQCGSNGSVIRHELQHFALRQAHVLLPNGNVDCANDPIYACDVACFPREPSACRGQTTPVCQ